MRRSENLIVFASGWSRPDFIWRPMAKRFELCGFDSIRIPFTGQGFGCIDESALVAHDVIEAVADFYSHVTFIGHSMGGLVGRSLIQKWGTREIDSYISLATPHFGSRLAQLAPWSKSAGQMRTDSRWLNDLNEHPWPEDVPALGVQAAWEEIVIPRSSAQIDFGSNVSIPRAVHASLPTHKRTFYEIWAWMNFQGLEKSGTYETEKGVSSRVHVS